MIQASYEESVRALIEQISAYIEQFHGGKVEMIALEDNILKVRPPKVLQ